MSKNPEIAMVPKPFSQHPVVDNELDLSRFHDSIAPRGLSSMTTNPAHLHKAGGPTPHHHHPLPTPPQRTIDIRPDQRSRELDCFRTSFSTLDMSVPLSDDDHECSSPSSSAALPSFLLPSPTAFLTKPTLMRHLRSTSTTPRDTKSLLHRFPSLAVPSTVPSPPAYDPKASVMIPYAADAGFAVPRHSPNPSSLTRSPAAAAAAPPPPASSSSSSSSSSNEAKDDDCNNNNNDDDDRDEVEKQDFSDSTSSSSSSAFELHPIIRSPSQSSVLTHHATNVSSPTCHTSLLLVTDDLDDDDNPVSRSLEDDERDQCHHSPHECNDPDLCSSNDSLASDHDHDHNADVVSDEDDSPLQRSSSSSSSTFCSSSSLAPTASSASRVPDNSFYEGPVSSPVSISVRHSTTELECLSPSSSPSTPIATPSDDVFLTNEAVFRCTDSPSSVSQASQQLSSSPLSTKTKSTSPRVVFSSLSALPLDGSVEKLIALLELGLGADSLKIRIERYAQLPDFDKQLQKDQVESLFGKLQGLDTHYFSGERAVTSHYLLWKSTSLRDISTPEFPRKKANAWNAVDSRVSLFGLKSGTKVTYRKLKLLGSDRRLVSSLNYCLVFQIHDSPHFRTSYLLFFHYPSAEQLHKTHSSVLVNNNNNSSSTGNTSNLLHTAVPVATASNSKNTNTLHYGRTASSPTSNSQASGPLLDDIPPIRLSNDSSPLPSSIDSTTMAPMVSVPSAALTAPTSLPSLGEGCGVEVGCANDPSTPNETDTEKRLRTIEETVRGMCKSHKELRQLTQSLSDRFTSLESSIHCFDRRTREFIQRDSASPSPPPPHPAAHVAVHGNKSPAFLRSSTLHSTPLSSLPLPSSRTLRSPLPPPAFQCLSPQIDITGSTDLLGQPLATPPPCLTTQRDIAQQQHQLQQAHMQTQQLWKSDMLEWQRTVERRIFMLEQQSKCNADWQRSSEIHISKLESELRCLYSGPLAEIHNRLHTFESSAAIVENTLAELSSAEQQQYLHRQQLQQQQQQQQQEQHIPRHKPSEPHARHRYHHQQQQQQQQQHEREHHTPTAKRTRSTTPTTPADLADSVLNNLPITRRPVGSDPLVRVVRLKIDEEILRRMTGRGVRDTRPTFYVVPLEQRHIGSFRCSRKATEQCMGTLDSIIPEWQLAELFDEECYPQPSSRFCHAFVRFLPKFEETLNSLDRRLLGFSASAAATAASSSSSSSLVSPTAISQVCPATSIIQPATKRLCTSFESSSAPLSTSPSPPASLPSKQVEDALAANILVSFGSASDSSTADQA